MKSLRLVFAALAFVLGAGFAFANVQSSQILFGKVINQVTQEEEYVPVDQLGPYTCNTEISDVCTATFENDDPINGEMLSSTEGRLIEF